MRSSSTAGRYLPSPVPACSACWTASTVSSPMLWEARARQISCASSQSGQELTSRLEAVAAGGGKRREGTGRVRMRAEETLSGARTELQRAHRVCHAEPERLVNVISRCDALPRPNVSVQFQSDGRQCMYGTDLLQCHNYLSNETDVQMRGSKVTRNQYGFKLVTGTIGSGRRALTSFRKGTSSALDTNPGTSFDIATSVIASAGGDGVWDGSSAHLFHKQPRMRVCVRGSLLRFRVRERV